MQSDLGPVCPVENMYLNTNNLTQQQQQQQQQQKQQQKHNLWSYIRLKGLRLTYVAE